MKARDAQDSSRDIAPLKPADDAVLIDNSKEINQIKEKEIKEKTNKKVIFFSRTFNRKFFFIIFSFL